MSADRVGPAIVARQVREALECVAQDEADLRVAAAFDVLCDLATDETLIRLRRLLR